MPDSAERPLVGAGAVVWRGNDVLLIRRGKAPRLGEWSLPGGRVERGEAVRDTAHRELMEETGCTMEIVALCDAVDSIGPGWHIVLVDFTGRWTGGDPRPGDDATDARFFPYAEIDRLGMWQETVRVIHASRKQIEAARS